MTLVELLCVTYGWTKEYAADELPFCQAVAFFRAIKARERIDDGSTPEDEEFLQAKGNQLKKQLRAVARDARRSQGK